MKPLLRFKTLIFLALSVACTGVAAHAGTKPQPDWSVWIYAATDADDLGPHADPIVDFIIQAHLSPNIEILLEQDTHLPQGTRRWSSNTGETTLPEHDSADPTVFRAFLDWAAANTTGKHVILAVLTHSWGWRGIIQDYDVPGRAKDENNNDLNGGTMMPVRLFSAAIQSSRIRPEILLLDTCVTGNVEPIEEFYPAANYLIVSQRETPYNGLPYLDFFKLLSQPDQDPREIARSIPELYVGAYDHRGSLVKAEGDYDVVTISAIDTSKWVPFRDEFSQLVKALDRAGFHQFLQADGEKFPGEIWDEDHNVDLVELLNRLPRVMTDPEVESASRAVLSHIAYPEWASRWNDERLTFDPQSESEFKVRIQLDPFRDRTTLQEAAIALFKDENMDLELPDTLSMKVLRSGPGPELEITGNVTASLSFRPWLPGTSRVKVSTKKLNGSEEQRLLRRDRTIVYVSHFPEHSFLLSEAHTQGAPFIHGIGIDFHVAMDNEEERAYDPITQLYGPAFYRSTAWNKATGWGDLMLLNR